MSTCEADAVKTLEGRKYAGRVLSRYEINVLSDKGEWGKLVLESKAAPVDETTKKSNYPAVHHLYIEYIDRREEMSLIEGYPIHGVFYTAEAIFFPEEGIYDKDLKLLKKDMTDCLDLEGRLKDNCRENYSRMIKLKNVEEGITAVSGYSKCSDCHGQ